MLLAFIPNILIISDFKQIRYQRKSGILIKKKALCALQWHLSLYTHFNFHQSCFINECASKNFSYILEMMEWLKDGVILWNVEELMSLKIQITDYKLTKE